MDLFSAKSGALIEQLRQHQVRHLLVGGYAVNIHGYSRGTGDMDIWIDATSENVLRLAAVLGENDFDVAALIAYAPQVPQEGLFLRIADDDFILDIMTQLDGVEFEAAYAHHVTYNLDGLEIHLIHRNDLVFNKLKAGRPKDLDDVQQLQYVEARWKGKKLDDYSKPSQNPD